MRVKELNNKLARVAWSPYNLNASYIACATAAEQSDLTVGINSTLDLLQFDLSNPSTDLEVVKSIRIESRCSKLIWSSSNKSLSLAKNLLISGCENTKIYLYDSNALLTSTDNNIDAHAQCLLKTLDNHQSGSIHSLDLNPFQSNLLASGAGQSEIFIWDLNNPSQPMCPGTKQQPLDDVQCVAWNNQVQHILASTSSGRCVVWDLRKNESIIKISENMSKLKAKLVAWHPDIATQLCLSSDDDHTPFMQLWDLRFSSSPVRVLEGHQRGILNFAWCSIDSNLLLSSAKDNRIICWNPNNATTNGEILYDLPTSGQWCFDLSWCQRHPDLICASSYEGQINVYSLMGGKYNVMHQTSSKIMDSFGVTDSSTCPQTPPAIQQQQIIIPQLKIAPKWMRRPCGVSFAFGGKLVTFASQQQQVYSHQEQQQSTPDPAVLNTQRVFINQVVTDSELIDKSQHLESTIQTGNLIEFCNYKIETAGEQTAEQSIWQFISASFVENKHEKFVQLLGLDNENLQSKLKNVVSDQKEETIKLNGHDNEENTENKMSKHFDNSLNFHQENGFDQIQEQEPEIPIDFKFNSDIENLLSESLTLGNVNGLVDLCIKENRFTEAILIANCFDDKSLLAKAQRIFFKNNESKFSKLLEKVLNRDWLKIVENSNLDHWKETLSLLITYTREQEMSQLCDSLGKRLESNGMLLNACICYICSENLDNFALCWQKLYENDSKQNETLSESAELQNLIEKIVTLKYCFRRYLTAIAHNSTGSSSSNSIDSKINAKMVQYAKLLADQGCFVTAYNYLMNDETTNDMSVALMKDRIYSVIDPQLINQFKLRKPESPFFKPQQQQQQNIPRKGSYYQQPPEPSQRQFAGASVTNQAHANLITSNPYGHPQPPLPTAVQPQSNMFSKSAIQQTPMPQPSQTSFFPGPGPTTSFMPQHPQQQHQQQQSSLMTSSSTLFHPQPIQTQPPNIPSMPSYMNTKPPVAWNDPPIVAPKLKPPPVSLQTNEIPSFFQPAVVPVAAPPSTYFNPAQQQQQPFQSNPHNNNNMLIIQQQQQQQQQQLFNPLKQQPFEPVAAPIPTMTNTAAEKGPIAPENQIIQSVFDGLLNKCMSITNAPAAKRKLEDVSKKLDVLYDKLRSSGETAQQQLSNNVIQGIHSIAQHMQISDYQSSLNLHSSLVATSNFSETSAFLTGIKVLIQQCQQANIHL